MYVIFLKYFLKARNGSRVGRVVALHVLCPGFKHHSHLN